MTCAGAGLTTDVAQLSCSPGASAQLTWWCRHSSTYPDQGWKSAASYLIPPHDPLTRLAAGIHRVCRLGGGTAKATEARCAGSSPRMAFNEPNCWVISPRVHSTVQCSTGPPIRTHLIASYPGIPSSTGTGWLISNKRSNPDKPPPSMRARLCVCFEIIFWDSRTLLRPVPGSRPAEFLFSIPSHGSVQLGFCIESTHLALHWRSQRTSKQFPLSKVACDSCLYFRAPNLVVWAALLSLVPAIPTSVLSPPTIPFSVFEQRKAA